MRLAQQRIGKETETFRECFRVEIDSFISTALLDSLALFKDGEVVEYDNFVVNRMSVLIRPKVGQGLSVLLVRWESRCWQC